MEKNGKNWKNWKNWKKLEKLEKMEKLENWKNWKKIIIVLVDGLVGVENSLEVGIFDGEEGTTGLGIFASSSKVQQHA